ncbi:MAG: hypothetical protein ABSA68_12485 [Xanthobacteraceae bacterium]
MNEYLAKLHRLESASKGLSAEKALVGELTKPTKLGSVSFVSAQSRGISGTEAGAAADEAVTAMQSGTASGLERGCYGNRQNRQNYPYADDLDHLDRCCPEYVEPERWRQCILDAQRFLAGWGDKASALGWTGTELFGLHAPPAKPHPSYSRLSRYDATGLLWLLQGRRVAALTADTAAITTLSGGILTYRKLRKPAFGPVGDSLDDFVV